MLMQPSPKSRDFQIAFTEFALLHKCYDSYFISKLVKRIATKKSLNKWVIIRFGKLFFRIVYRQNKAHELFHDLNMFGITFRG
jgi:hypothetical protein